MHIPFSKEYTPSFQSNPFTYFIDTISVHQSLLLNPVDIEGTQLKQEIPVRLGLGRGCGRGGSHCIGSILRTGGIRLLWGRNERHALEEASLFLSCRLKERSGWYSLCWIERNRRDDQRLKANETRGCMAGTVADTYIDMDGVRPRVVVLDCKKNKRCDLSVLVYFSVDFYSE